MNARGQYGPNGHYSTGTTCASRTYVGASLVHVLELKQRYDNVKTAALAKLLSELSKTGVQTSLGENTWQIALRNHGWVRLQWFPMFNGLEVTVTDREQHRDDEVPSVQREYEQTLRLITPLLQQYGGTTVGAAAYVGRDVYVGQGSIIPHTPGEIEDELKQLNREMLAFGQEAIELIKPLEAQAKNRVQTLRDEEAAAWKVSESFQPLVKEVYRIEELLNKAGLSKKTTAEWREQPPPYDNIRNTPMLSSTGAPIPRAEDIKKQFIAAKEALDKFMPKAQRLAAIKAARDASQRRSMAEGEQLREFPLVRWKTTVWNPFFEGWRDFYSQKIDIPMQTLPGSGTWDRIQEYRKQFIELRKNAPFKAQGPAPLDPTGRTDPSLTGGLRDIWGGAGDVFGIAKWGLIGALGIGAIVAVAAVVSNVRKGKDPSEKYLELIREGRRSSRAPRSLPAGRGQRALPAGSEDE